MHKAGQYEKEGTRLERNARLTEFEGSASLSSVTDSLVEGLEDGLVGL